MSQETQVIDPGFVNAFLVKTTDGCILIDTGTAKQWTRLESELLKTGCLPADLRLVLITHGDFDHTGNCAVLQRKYGVKVGMHPGDVPMVQTGVTPVHHARGCLAKLLLRLGNRMSVKSECFQPGPSGARRAGIRPIWICSNGSAHARAHKGFYLYPIG
jgi:glyoxylase-like metal-dependent hydrolase (beta-lactamase superfamily II)